MPTGDISIWSTSDKAAESILRSRQSGNGSRRGSDNRVRRRRILDGRNGYGPGTGSPARSTLHVLTRSSAGVDGSIPVRSPLYPPTSRALRKRSSSGQAPIPNRSPTTSGSPRRLIASGTPTRSWTGAKIPRRGRTSHRWRNSRPSASSFFLTARSRVRCRLPPRTLPCPVWRNLRSVGT